MKEIASPDALLSALDAAATLARLRASELEAKGPAVAEAAERWRTRATLLTANLRALAHAPTLADRADRWHEHEDDCETCQRAGWTGREYCGEGRALRSAYAAALLDYREARGR